MGRYSKQNLKTILDKKDVDWKFKNQKYSCIIYSTTVDYPVIFQGSWNVLSTIITKNTDERLFKNIYFGHTYLFN